MPLATPSRCKGEGWGGGRLSRKLLDRGAAASELFLKPLEAAIKLLGLPVAIRAVSNLHRQTYAIPSEADIRLQCNICSHGPRLCENVRAR